MSRASPWTTQQITSAQTCLRSAFEAFPDTGANGPTDSASVANGLTLVSIQVGEKDDDQPDAIGYGVKQVRRSDSVAQAVDEDQRDQHKEEVHRITPDS